MRIYTETNAFVYPNCGRLCLDNVLMAEPVRAGYLIVRAKIDPLQPLIGNQVGAEAWIGSKLMDPVGIRVYLSGVTGTNNWGYRNWWGSGLVPTTGVTTVELVADTNRENCFVTAPGSGLPSNPIDTVMQYVFWGTYSNMPGRPIFQETNTFANPAWYNPVNLNAQFAASGWSPYYFVYSCPTGSVWINEFNYARNTGEGTNEYVELIGPAGANIGKWRIEVLSSSQIFQDGCAVSNNFTFTNTVNGWGFFVYGDPTVRGVNQTFSNATAQNIPLAGGALRLIRSMGAWEDLVCYAGASGLTAFGYRYAGSKQAFVNSPLHLYGASGDSKWDFQWQQPSGGNYTPGAINKDQYLTNAPLLPLGTWTIWSILGPNGTHSIAPWTNVTVTAGGSTQIVYTADQWHRIAAFTTNGLTNAAALDATQYTWSVSNVYQDLSNNVTFYRPMWAVWQTVGAGGASSSTGTVYVPNGLSTSIAYNAASWYRIASLQTNGVSLPAAQGASQYVWSVNPAVQNYSNDASFAYATPQQTGYPSNIPTAWLAKWSWSEGSLSNNYDHDVLTLPQEYWFDSDPTFSNAFSFGTTAFSLTGNTVYASVRLLLDGARITSLNTNATLRLVASITPAGAGSTIYETNVSATTFDTGGVWRVSRAPVTNSAVFLRPTITDTPSGWTP
jgi:hypothetical protein